MPAGRPSLSSVHVSRVLDRVAIGYQSGMNALDAVAPRIPVRWETGTYFVFDLGSAFRREAEVGRPSTRAPRGGYDLTTATYETKLYEHGTEVYWRIANQLDTPIRAYVESAQHSMDKVKLEQEWDRVSLLTTSSNWGGATDLSANFWNTGTSAIVSNVRTAREEVRSRCGVLPNTMVMSWEVLEAVLWSTEILGYITYGSPGNPQVADIDLLRRLFKIQRIIVVDRQYTADPVGTSSPTLSSVMGDDVWIGYVAERPGINAPSAMYTFVAGAPGTRTYVEEADKRDVVEAFENQVTKVTLSGAGWCILNTLNNDGD